MLTSTIQTRFIRINEVFYLATDLTIDSRIDLRIDLTIDLRIALTIDLRIALTIDSRIDLTIASTIALIIRCIFCEGGEYTHYKVSISCNRIKTRIIGGK